MSSIKIPILKEDDERGWYPEQQSFLKEIRNGIVVR